MDRRDFIGQFIKWLAEKQGVPQDLISAKLTVLSNCYEGDYCYENRNDQTAKTGLGTDT